MSDTYKIENAQWRVNTSDLVKSSVSVYDTGGETEARSAKEN